MQTTFEVLRNLGLVTYTSLGVAAVFMWRRRPIAAHAWLAATFSLLAFLVAGGRALPLHSHDLWVIWARKVLLALLALFPYFLYRFVATFRRPTRWIFVAAPIATALVALWSLVLPEIPEPGAPTSTVFRALLFVFGLQWVSLGGLVAIRLWRAGRGQPMLARRRMQTLACGSFGMSAALVLAFSAHSSQRGILDIVVQILALSSALLFLLGSAPPAPVRALWRRHDAAALRSAEMGLVKALSIEDVAEALLPDASRSLGGHGACIIDASGKVLGSFGLDEQALADLSRAAPAWPPSQKGVIDGELLRVPLQMGWLVVLSSVFAPFFGTEEIQALESLAALADLALERAVLLERQIGNVEAMREFVAIASHEMRTPVTVISGFAGLLVAEWGELDEKERLDMLASIDRNSKHLAHLTEDLLTVSRIETGNIEPHPERISVRSSIERVVHDSGAEFSPEPELVVDSELSVYADPDHFDRMLFNYLSNAYDYGRFPVSIVASNGGPFVRLAVKDCGPGVPPDFADRLFRKFARADKKMSKATDGTGLGLSIVKGLARAAGGDAWYEPNDPIGSTFGLSLPGYDASIMEPVNG